MAFYLVVEATDIGGDGHVDMVHEREDFLAKEVVVRACGVGEAVGEVSGDDMGDGWGNLQFYNGGTERLLRRERVGCVCCAEIEACGCGCNHYRWSLGESQGIDI